MSNNPIGKYEKKSLIERIKEAIKGIFSTKGKELLAEPQTIEKYAAEEVQKLVEVREGIQNLSEKEKQVFEQEMTDTMTAEIKEYIDKEEQQNNKDIDKKLSKSDNEKSEGIRDINSKKIGYLDRLELLNQMKRKSLKEQLKKEEFVPDQKSYYKELLLQKSIENDREKYLEGKSEEEKKKILKLEEEYLGKNLDIERQQNQKYREKLAELDKLNTKLKDINEMVEQKQREMREDKISPDEYKKIMEEQQLELEDTLTAIAALNPEKLEEAALAKEKNKKLEKKVMGKNYREAVYLRSSDEMKERLDYRTEKESEQKSTILKENKLFRKEGIEKSIEQYEKHREELEEELEKLKEDNPLDIERKQEILKELHITDKKLDSYERQKQDIEYGLEKDIDIEAKLDNEEKMVEDSIKEIEEDFEPIEANIEALKENVAAPENRPEKEKEQIEEKANKIGTKVAVATVVVDDCPHDVEHAVVNGYIAEKIVSKSLRDEWSTQINSKYDEEAVKAAQERQEAMEELAKQEEEYERTRTRND